MVENIILAFISVSSMTHFLLLFQKGCGSKDCNSCTCDMYCCCTTHEHSAMCDDIPKYKHSSKTSKMDQDNLESNNGDNSENFNETTVTKDCDTNSEHSSMMNDSIHSSFNNRYNFLIAWICIILKFV